MLSHIFLMKISCKVLIRHNRFCFFLNTLQNVIAIIHNTVSFQYLFSFNPIAATTMLKILTKIATEEAAHVSLC